MNVYGYTVVREQRQGTIEMTGGLPEWAVFLLGALLLVARAAAVAFTIAALLALGGCIRDHAVTLPDNAKGYVLECDDLTDCYDHAHGYCPAGYQVDNQATGWEHHKDKYSLVVRCKAGE